jgi:hypothetical protein
MMAGFLASSAVEDIVESMQSYTPAPPSQPKKMKLKQALKRLVKSYV